MELNPLGKTFFPGVKKYCFLDNYVPLRGRGDAEGNGGLSQKKLMLSMELTGDMATGMPSWIGDAIDCIAEDEAGIARIKFDKTRTMPGMTVEVYATADTKERALLITACEFAHFKIERQGIEEASRFWLTWQVRCADPLQLHQWLHGHYHQQFAVAFSQGQETMNFDKGEEPTKEAAPKKDTNQAKLAYPEGNPADAEFAGAMRTAAKSRRQPERPHLL